jgi:hypothetical protein
MPESLRSVIARLTPTPQIADVISCEINALYFNGLLLILKRGPHLSTANGQTVLFCPRQNG